MEADVIIINENGIANGQFATDNIHYPTKVDGRWVRVAHIYLYARTYVGRAFELAGLQHLKVSSSVVIERVFKSGNRVNLLSETRFV